MNDARLAYVLGVAGISLLAAACGGEKASHMQGSNTTSTAAPAAAPTPAGGAAAGSTAAGGAVAGSTGTAGAAAGSTSTAAPGGAAQGGGGASSITAAEVALGDSIFHGQTAGGTCFTCHGQDAKGTALAPDLSDKTWIDGDGSYNYIVQRVTTGVPQPKQHPAPMPPMGGASLSQAQVRAVSAYVYSLSNPGVGK